MAIAADTEDARTTTFSDPKAPATPPIEADDDADDPDDITVEDWAQAENSRPTLPDETADGLDDMDEEVRHQAEDLPLAESGDIDDRE